MIKKIEWGLNVKKGYIQLENNKVRGDQVIVYCQSEHKPHSSESGNAVVSTTSGCESSPV